MIAGRVGEKFFLRSRPPPTLEAMQTPESKKETGAVPEGLSLELLRKRQILDNPITGMIPAESTAGRVLGVPTVTPAMDTRSARASKASRKIPPSVQCATQRDFVGISHTRSTRNSETNSACVYLTGANDLLD